MEEVLLVYVVDDDSAVRDSLVALLEPEGFLIRQYATVADFLGDLEGSLPEEDGRACVLLDLHMPGKGGQELLNILVNHNSGLPVIVMTGNTHEKTRSLALATGAVAFLEKPVDADWLIDTLRKAFR